MSGKPSGRCGTGSSLTRRKSCRSPPAIGSRREIQGGVRPRLFGLKNWTGRVERLHWNGTPLRAFGMNFTRQRPPTGMRSGRPARKNSLSFTRALSGKPLFGGRGRHSGRLAPPSSISLRGQQIPVLGRPVARAATGEGQDVPDGAERIPGAQWCGIPAEHPIARSLVDHHPGHVALAPEHGLLADAGPAAVGGEAEAPTPRAREFPLTRGRECSGTPTGPICLNRSCTTRCPLSS